MTASAVTTIVQDGEAFLAGVVTDVKTWIGDIETVVVDDAKVAWLALQPILTAIGPQQWTILQGLLNTVSKDLAADDYAGLMADVVAQASAAEIAWVGQLSTSLLQIMVTALQSTKAPTVVG